MAFWSTNNVEPTRQYRFIVGSEHDNYVWWWAKSCDKPTIDIDSQEYKLINHKYKYPGVANWSDIKISIVDVGEKAKNLITIFGSTGWNIGGMGEAGIAKDKSQYFLGQMQIHQIDSSGRLLEKWTLKNAWAKSISFGSLDYSNDELVTIDITLAYDYATFSTNV